MSSEDQNIKNINRQGEIYRKKLFEIFSVLDQGIKLNQYDVIDGSKSLKEVWMNSEKLRIFIDKSRPSVIQKIQGKISSGIYLRDISDIRKGFLNFLTNREDHDENEKQYLTIISSESTACLEFPSEFLRDWFFDRFLILFDQILSRDEKRERLKTSFLYNPLKLILLTSVGALEEDYVRSPDVKSAHRCRNALLTGFQVLHHDKQTQIVYRCILGLDQESNCFNLTPCSVVVETEQKPKNLQLLSKMVCRAIL